MTLSPHYRIGFGNVCEGCVYVNEGINWPDLIETILREHNISVSELAVELGVPRQTISNWRVGRFRPSAERGRRLLRFSPRHLKAWRP